MAFLQMNPGTLLSPVPAVMLSCAGRDDKPNIITVAWVGTVCSTPPMLSVSIRKERYSHALISDTGEFVVNLVGESLLKSLDFCGVKSGRDVDKFAACGLTASPVPDFSFAPAIGETPLYLACKVKNVIELGSHDLFIADILRVAASDQILSADRKTLDLKKAGLIAYCHGTYHQLSDALGFFGFSVAAPDVYKRRMSELRR